MSSPLWSSLQHALGITPDGIPGKITCSALAARLHLPSTPTLRWEDIQKELGLKSDGVPGILTGHQALRRLQLQDENFRIIWPREREAEAFFGKAGQGLQLIELPYPLRLSWDTGELVKTMTCHSLTAIPLKRIFRKTLAHYGMDNIRRLGLDLFGGCYNNRPKVGGSTLSMHAYGIAIDLDPDHNQLKWKSDKAGFARHYYDEFWSFVEQEGAVSLGRQKDYDWMHFQFARLNT